MHARKEAGVVVDFVPKGATHNERVVSLHSLLDADFYREGARVTPAPRRRIQRRAKRKLDAGAVARAGHARRAPPAQRDPARVATRRPEVPRRRRAAVLGLDRRAADPLRGAHAVRREADGRPRDEGALEQFLATCAAENPNRRLRMMALADRVSMRVDRADFDDLVTLVTSAPTWDKDRLGGIRTLLRAIGEGNADAPEQILARWTWRLARAREGARPQSVAGVPRGEAPARCARELARAPPRGERREARQHRARAAEARRRRAPRLRRGIYAARDEAARRRARAARRDRRGCARAGREPAAAEDPALAQAPTAPAEEEAGRGAAAAAAAGSAQAGAATARSRNACGLPSPRPDYCAAGPSGAPLSFSRSRR